MRIGITFGCYIPLHKGHMKLIEKSLKENDQTIVAVCGKDNDRGKDFIPFNMRVSLMYDKYRDAYMSGKLNVVKIDDNKIGMDGSFSLRNWEIWCNELFSQANEIYRSCGKPEIDPTSEDNTITWYTGEPSYKEKIGSIYKNHVIDLTDRNEIALSGTMIRENPEKYAEYIAYPFREYLIYHKFIDASVSDKLYTTFGKRATGEQEIIALRKSPEVEEFDSEEDARAAAAPIIASKFDIELIYAYEEVWADDPEDFTVDDANIVFTYKRKDSNFEHTLVCYHGLFERCKDCQFYDNYTEYCKMHNARVCADSPICRSYAYIADEDHEYANNPFRKE